MTLAFDENALRAALGRAAASVGATVVVDPEDDFALRVDHRIAVHERRAVRRRRAVVGALAAFVLAAGLAAFALGHSTPTVEPVSPRSPGWAPMAPAPIGPRNGHRPVWTGEELLFFGGVSQSGDYDGAAAAYDPAADSWRPITGYEERVGRDAITGISLGVIVWADDQVLALATDGTLHAYDVDTDRWRDLAPFPFDSGGEAVIGYGTAGVWTGTELVVANSGNLGLGLPTGAAAYDPANDSWRSLPASPFELDGVDVVWTGRTVLTVGHDRIDTTTRRLAVVALDPTTGAWTRLPDPPIGVLENRRDVYLVWTGTELVVGGGNRVIDNGSVVQLDVAAYDPEAGTWRVVPAPPVAVLGQQQAPEIWTGSEVVLWAATGAIGNGGQPVLLDPATGRWRFGPRSPDGGREGSPATWAGDTVVWWSGDLTDGVQYLPECCGPGVSGSLFTP